MSCLNELLCVLLYTFVFPTLPIVKLYRSKAASEGSKAVAGDLAAAGVPTQHDEQVCLIFFLIYVLTLSIFPGFLSEDTGSHGLGTWYALVLITMFNAWDLVGRYMCPSSPS